MLSKSLAVLILNSEESICISD